MESFLEIDCSGYSEDILDVFKAFHRIGWWIYNSEKEVEYLPIADDDNFNWQREKILEEEFYNIINMKNNNGEVIGVNLFYNNSNVGISMLAHGTKCITLGMSINRKKVYEKFTDIAWYIENIIYKLFELDVRIVSYRFGEFED